MIDLGSYQLQVAEACSGLRYLFPLMAMGFIVTCFFRAPLWQRLFVFFSTIPITVLVNSFRIGVIGVMVEHWGKWAAEGFLHDFEGWVIFMACFGGLFVEMWLLVRLSGDRRPFREIFILDFSAPSGGETSALQPVTRQSLATLVVLLLAVWPAMSLPERGELTPARAKFSDFPTQLGDWRGTRDKLEEIYIDALMFDDYIFANYHDGGKNAVNLYSAYYASQRNNQSAHSPRSCIPGGGWRINEFGQRDLQSVKFGGYSLHVNRALIQHGADRQLVYYWFQQRGRIITNEYAVKWYLFWDSLTKNRSDGALVRLTTPLREGQASAAADAQLEDFAAVLMPQLDRYIPD